ncbi:MAG: amino acid ABC transporter permease [Candidatus Accumulibacter sp.]|jgi:polar amino acid transport system permease protein|nr:amino acid ABC transporter permease [Accumulibacter sp.]
MPLSETDRVVESGLSVLLDVNNLQRLSEGLLVTLKVAVLSIALALALGIVIGLIALSPRRIVQIPYRLFLETIRIVPQIVWLFIVFFGLAKLFGWNWSGETVGVVVFGLWGAAEMADLVRAAVASLPTHQTQSAQALALSKAQIYRYVLVPQALRRLIPASINLATRIIKTTPLLVLITVVEVLKVGQQIIETKLLTMPSAALWIYAFIFFIYFAICYPVSLASRRLEEKWNTHDGRVTA